MQCPVNSLVFRIPILLDLTHEAAMSGAKKLIEFRYNHGGRDRMTDVIGMKDSLRQHDWKVSNFLIGELA